MKPILFISFLILTSCFIPGPMPSQSKWKLEIKNEYGTDDPIVLKGGRFTKISLILSPEDGEKYLDYSQDKSKFKIYTKDEFIEIPGNEFELEPAKGLEYSAYIGLKCESLINITQSFYLIEFQVKGEEEGISEEETKPDDQKQEQNLILQPLNVTIDSTPTKIKLSPLQTSIPEESFTVFKLKERLYNMEKITITPKNEYPQFKFNKIEFKEFKVNKIEEEEEEFEENDGILFDYKVGTHLTYDKLNQTNFHYELEINEDQKCFVLEGGNFTFEVLDQRYADLTNGTKEAIVYSIENVTPKRDETNNIQIKMNIPVSPIILECELEYGEDGEIKKNYYITETGEKILKFDNLNFENKEYSLECEFKDTRFDNGHEFKIEIGNKKGADVIMNLIPSQDINRIPQCAKFIFNDNSNIDALEQFESLAVKYCTQLMNEEESIMSRIMQNIICKSIEIEDDYDYDDDEDDDDKEGDQKKEEEKDKDKDKDKKKEIKKKYTICTGPSYNSPYMMNNVQEKKINITENFKKFTDNLSTKTKINETLGLSDLDILSIETYYDNEVIDTSKIKIEKVKKDKDEFKFNITSNNPQPIECFYNEEFNMKYNKKYIELDVDSVILNEGETKNIEVEIKDKPNKETILSLYMNCYNLPGFPIRYESTGVFIAYSFYYNENETEEDDDDDDEDEMADDDDIDCREEKYRKHPYCLKDRSNPIIDEMKTKMPDFIEEMMEQSSVFETLPASKQFQYLEQTKNELEDNRNKMKEEENQQNRKELVEKSTELAEFLNKRDCSLYKDENKYKECRDKKKDILNDLISDIENYFQCEKMIEIIQEGMTDDVEQNLKYILFLISEITNNADSLKEGQSEVLYNITLCLQENFEEYWENVQSSLEQKSSLNSTILSIKKDISFMLLKSLSNLINILHYDEIDGYIKNDNISKEGIMENPEGKKIQKGIFNFIKHFNDFGNGTYNITDKMNVSVTVFDEEENQETKTRLLIEENEEENEKQIYNFTDKGIYVILHPKKMIKKKGGHALQFVIFESPLISIEKDEKTVRDFISITIYDKNGNEINITNLSDDEKPIILYNKSYHKNLKNCFYYNESTEELKSDGIEATDDANYEGKKYFKCSSKHLTAFTAGDYSEESGTDDSDSDSDSDSSNGWKIFLIILSCLIIIAIVAFLIYHFRKTKVDNKTIEKNFSGEDGIMTNV